MVFSRREIGIWTLAGASAGLLLLALWHPVPSRSRPAVVPPKPSVVLVRVKVVPRARAEEPLSPAALPAPPPPAPPAVTAASRPLPKPPPSPTPKAVAPPRSVPLPAMAQAPRSPSPTPAPSVAKSPEGAPRRAAVPEETPEARRELGRQLMGVDGKREGAVPLISMDYRQHLGWGGYVRSMQQLGGQFFLFDHRAERIVALADVERGEFLAADDGALAGLSPRLREVRQEVAVEGLMRQAAARYAGRDLALVLLVPLNLDFEVVGGVVRGLEALGYPAGEVGRVEGVYERQGGRLTVRVQRVIRRDGTSHPADFAIGL